MDLTRNYIITFICFSFCLLFFSGNAFAQEKTTKKMLIIKKTVDKDGNETIERIEKEGNEVEDIDKMIEEYVGDDVKVNIESDDKEGKMSPRQVRIIKKELISENGEKTIDVDVQVEDEASIQKEEVEEEIIIRKEKTTKGKNEWIQKDGKVIILDDNDDVKILKKGDKTIIKKERIIIKEGKEVSEEEIEKMVEELLEEEGIDAKEGTHKTIIIKEGNLEDAEIKKRLEREGIQLKESAKGKEKKKVIIKKKIEK